jgi:mRNA-degrading endonuclease RelE of RelBE toxin-antitoxin system
MNYNIFSIPPFDRQLKRLVKKYPSLKEEFLLLLESLSIQPAQGTPIGRNCYKIRISISSKGKGKSGGARIITNLVVAENSVFLLAIYDKNEKETLTDKELATLLQMVPQ